MLKNLLLVSAMLMAVGNCKEITDYENCRPDTAVGELVSLVIEPCDLPVCVFEAYKNYSILLKFEPNMVCLNLTAVISIVLHPLIVINTEKQDVCPFLAVEGGGKPGCPSGKDDALLIKYIAYVPKVVDTSINLWVQLLLLCLGEDGVENDCLCAKVPLRIV